ncbi:DUF2388 domain-containing protein [Aquipseudomonas campi]|uniref:DUF2388 domain-containing protein n=1 Tax=Aquipseudomonas campi TaxID=2731681 RepID=A0A6M8G886_9GAMM|nr:DUF2388 domain-containing protein [Pseudomonas campi]QKE65045.1 DUF2388 domain-containing protein [Pseudomonas campi]
MKHLSFTTIITALMLTGTAQATSFVVTTDALGSATVGSTDSTSDISSSFGDDKIVLAARDDAASFVASQGEIRGARLEAALQHIRQQVPQLQADDLQLAQAILVL